jgi:uncharacterized damage-inducible protein DinB
MHKLLATFLLAGVLPAQNSTKKPTTLREVLLEQLHTTHDNEDWYVPINIAVEGLTPDQAKWTDGHGSHSVGQLVNHLAFWNERNLERFEGKPPGAYNGNNDETFNSFDSKTWAETVKRLDNVMKAWEKAVAEADDAKIAAEASRIAHVGAHNAYHLGQIMYVRKLQGAWDPSKGVK